MMHKPVKFEHGLQSHPAIVKLYQFFQKFVSWKVVISKVVLEREDLFRMEILLSNKVCVWWGDGGRDRITSICRATFISVGDMSS